MRRPTPAARTLDGGGGPQAGRQVAPQRALRLFEVVMIDEAQDMTPMLFEFTCKALRDIARARDGACAPPPRTVIHNSETP